MSCLSLLWRRAHVGPVLFLVIFFRCCQPVFCDTEGATESLSGRYRGCNVILIILDALRYDHLGCYGYPGGTSPNIDTLAEEGFIFTNAFSQSSLTLPSVVSIFTSLYPFSHNARMIFKDGVPDDAYTLAQILQTYGYKTVWFGSLKDPHSGSGRGVLKGFEDKIDFTKKKKRKRFKNDASYPRMSEWVARHKNEAFFMTIHSYFPHEQVFPYKRFDNKFSKRVPKKYFDSLEAIQKKWWEEFQRALKGTPNEIADILGEDVLDAIRDEYLDRPFSKETTDGLFGLLSLVPHKRDSLMEHWRRPHYEYFSSFEGDDRVSFLWLLDSAIYHLDTHLMARLMQDLKKAGCYEKTVMIIIADHGNEFKEHGHIGHGCFLYDESIHIPFLLHLPGATPSKRLDALVQSIDILPTTLDLLGIPVPVQAQGRSLVGLLDGHEEAAGNDHVYSQTFLGMEAVRTKTWKLIRHPDRPEESQLFDLAADPGEKVNLIREKKDMADALGRRLDDFKKGLRIDGHEASEFSPWVDEKARERIRKTGYW